MDGCSPPYALAMGDAPASRDDLDELATRISGWLDELQVDNPLIEAVDRDETGERRWFVRLEGEERDHTTVWLHLRQRTLHHESYVLPAPVDDPAAFYENLLRRNVRLRGVAFAIGEEDAAYLVGTPGWTATTSTASWRCTTRRSSAASAPPSASASPRSSAAPPADVRRDCIKVHEMT